MKRITPKLKKIAYEFCAQYLNTGMDAVEEIGCNLSEEENNLAREFIRKEVYSQLQNKANRIGRPRGSYRTH